MSLPEDCVSLWPPGSDEPPAAPASRIDFAARARRLRLVITDCDGVLTDTSIYYSDAGEAMRRFSVRDGMGVELLRNSGIETVILTREQSPMIARRGEKLRLPKVYLGVRDKVAHLATVLADGGVQPAELAYIGDDVNDLEIMHAVAAEGLTAAPADAMPAVTAIAHYHSAVRGGAGAFRDFAEWLLALRAADDSHPRDRREP